MKAIEHRKAEHLRINIEENVAGKGISAGFEQWRFEHVALPEISLATVDLTAELFGRQLGAPILLSCMTGGVEEAGRLNRELAGVAQVFGLPMGLGSGRALLEDPALLPTFLVRAEAPDVPLLANLGAIQLNRGVSAEACRRLVDQLQADALVLHLNPLQEALQAAGDTDFSGLLGRIATLCSELECPVVVKEVGWGIAADLVRRLWDAGVAAIDVAGAGGTSWSEVERHRLDNAVRARVAGAFAGWGIPTATAILEGRAAAPEATLIASGGIADGIDIAKSIALGADLAGLAGPFLRAAAAGSAAELAAELCETLRLAMFAIGASDLSQLRNSPRLKPA
ncbi:MAG: type 2 isopentenyl-diphosphate Delta-isomerase [Candidatus Dormibacter sp.]|uniref:type 2 isopentenyl-diphosphate Delta-isomerase n=1 Tax=Candidatus Dormibacter sp. TaxID=2973982 RepID=UPI000DB6D8DA|nr:MAG: type 2 isopentenyl-diphosphate Delta-isomerase [Candidatus Dormibacteraeota bacterium]